MKKVCIFIIIIIILGNLSLSIEQQNYEEEIEDIEEMVHINYAKDSDVDGDVYPENAHLVYEYTDNDAIYFVDQADETILKKVVPSTGIVSTIYDATGDIFAFWPDRDNGRLYYAFRAGNTVFVDYITLATDVRSNYNSIGFAFTAVMKDIFIADSKVWSFFNEVQAAAIFLYIYDHTTPAAHVSGNMGNPTARTYDYTQISAVGNDIYFLWKWSDENVELWKVNVITHVFTEMEDCGAATELPTKDQQAISYDGSDILYFVLQDTGNSKYYLYTYIIGPPDILTKGAEYNVALMMNRNTDTSNEVPFNLEKGFHITNRFIYQITQFRGDFYKIGDLTYLVSDGTIIAITDTYLFILRGDLTNVEIWKYQNISNDIETQKVFYKQSTPTMAIVETELIFGKQQIIELYDTISNPGFNTLAFRGAIKNKKYQGGLRKYECRSYDNEVFSTKFTEDYRGAGLNAKEIMEDLLDKYGSYLYYTITPDSIDPNGDFIIIREPVFENKTFAEAFDELMHEEDGAWTWEPDGKIFAWFITEIPFEQLSTQVGFLQATWNFKDDTIGLPPAGGWDIDEGGGTVNIIAEFQGHNKVLDLHDTVNGNDVVAGIAFTGQTTGTIEYYAGSDDVTDISAITVRDGGIGGTIAILFGFINDQLAWHDGGGWNNIKAVVNDTWYHIKLIFDTDTDTYDIWVDEVLEQAGATFFALTGAVDYLRIASNNAQLNYHGYYNAIGFSWDNKYVGVYDIPYEVGDNLIEEHIHVSESTKNIYQTVPLLEEIMEQINKITVYGGIVNGARLKNEAGFGEDLASQLIHGIIDFVDYFESLRDQTEVNNMADSLLNRTGLADNPFYITVSIQGLGYRTIMRSFSFRYNAYEELPDFATYYIQELELDLDDVTIGKYIISSGLVQKEMEIKAQNQLTSKSDEGQIDILAAISHDRIGFTFEGGIWEKVTNKTGAVSIKGTVVEASTTTDNAFQVVSANGPDPIGIVYENGIVDGLECKIIIYGRCQVLLKDATASTHGNWAGVSDVAGRADITGASPPAAPAHFKEIGHGFGSQGAGVDVLAFIICHFN